VYSPPRGPTGYGNARGPVTPTWGSMRAAICARVSTADQQPLPLQIQCLEEYAANRGWTLTQRLEEQASRAKDSRPKRAEIMKAARRRDIDVVLVWKLDRWGRSMADLATTLNELQELGVGFVSLTEALDFTKPSGRAMAGLQGVFADYERELIRERVKTGIAHARANGKPNGRPAKAREKAKSVRKLAAEGLSQGEIARRLLIHRRSVGRVLATGCPLPDHQAEEETGVALVHAEGHWVTAHSHGLSGTGSAEGRIASDRAPFSVQ